MNVQNFLLIAFLVTAIAGAALVAKPCLRAFHERDWPVFSNAVNEGLILERPLGEDRGSGRNAPFEICAANEARFTTATFSEALTAYAVGWKDPADLKALLDFLFPEVETSNRFEFKRAKNAEALLSELDDIRQIGAAFKRVEYTGDTVLGKTINKGLTMRVDHDAVPKNVPGWENRYVGLLLQRLVRNDLRRGTALADASVTNGNKTWPDDGTACNPDKDIRAALVTASDSSGVRPNRILFAEDAWNARQDSYEAINTPAAGRAAELTKEELARKLLVDRIEIGNARYQSSASAKSKLTTTMKLYMFFAEQAAMLEDASNFKRCVSRCEDGQFTRVYIERMMKYTDISVEHYSALIAAHTLGLRSITVSKT